MNQDPVRVLKALADASRWRIVTTLAEGPATTGTLAALFEQTRFGVMKHLEVLVEAGLVLVERRGRERWNHLNPVPLALALDALNSPLSAQWTSRLTALKQAVEREEEPMDTPNILDIRQEIRLAAPPERVFRVLTEDIDLWWTAPYRMTAAGRISLEPRVGGELREEDPSGHVAIWGRVDQIAVPRLLVMSGGFGIKDAVAGRVRLELTSVPEGTVLGLSHLAMGVLGEEVVRSYRGGWAELLGTRLRARVEAA
jgi:uncharacterized protein YndB with AHSA1/START domain